MYEKDLAQCLGHSRCSINVRVPFFFIAVKIVMMKGI